MGHRPECIFPKGGEASREHECDRDRGFDHRYYDRSDHFDVAFLYGPMASVEGQGGQGARYGPVDGPRCRCGCRCDDGLESLRGPGRQGNLAIVRSIS